VAVTLVVVGHLYAFLGFLPAHPFNLACLGGLGVSIFFVHTCLVLMQSLERQEDRRLVPFMIRRCFRIYPLALVAIGTTLLFRLPLGSLSSGHFGGFRPDAQDVLANLLLVQNFSGRAAVLGPTWSLSYELQMYLLLPALFLWVRTARQALIAWVGVAVLSAGIATYSGTVNLSSFAPCFMAGIVAYRLRYRPQIPGWSLFLAGFVLLYLAGPDSRYFTWFAMLGLGLAIPAFAQVTNRSLIRAGEWVARYSYGIYLTHFFTLWLVFEKGSSLPFAARITGFVALTAALSWVLFHAIEQPMIQFGKRTAERYSGEV
jgi:peptidoglycan/LPS O-acetylase OafA/YrhL